MNNTLRNVAALWRRGVVALSCCGGAKRRIRIKVIFTVPTEYLSLLRYTLHTSVCDLNITTYVECPLVNIEWQANDALTVDSIMLGKLMIWFTVVFVFGCWIVLLGEET